MHKSEVIAGMYDLTAAESENGDVVFRNNTNGKYIILGYPEAQYFCRLISSEELLSGIPHRGDDTRTLTVEEGEYLMSCIRKSSFLSGKKPAPLQWIKYMGISKIQLIRFDPSHILNRIPRSICSIFSGWGICASAALGLFMLLLMRLNGTDILYDLQRENESPEALLTAGIISIISLAFHETAHGMACRYYGGTVRGMGIMLYFFIPCPFCDVSDIYMMKKRRHRLWVSLAGISANMITGDMAIAVYLISGKGTEPGRGMLYFCIFNIITILFNLIPFVKLDGYWALSAVSGIFNLMGRAEEALADRLDRILRKSIHCCPAAAYLALYGGAVVVFRPVFWMASAAGLRGILGGTGAPAGLSEAVFIAAAAAGTADTVLYIMKIFRKNRRDTAQSGNTG
ncbi:MAG: hypothetical protein HUJ76_02530 [Parasporobacterium sp.]|nr:hypothetical protein [Parasporobacterium sp.]